MLQIRSEPPVKKIKDMNLKELNRELSRLNYYIGSHVERKQLDEAADLRKQADKVEKRIAEENEKVQYYGQ